MKKFFYLFFLLIFTSQAYSLKELSLSEAIKLGLGSNGQYKGDSLGIIRAVTEYNELNFDYYPQISGQFTIKNNIQRSTTPFPLSLLSDTAAADDFKAVQFTTEWNSTIGLTFKQKILDFSFFSNQKIKLTDIQIAKYNELDSKNKIIQNIKAGYFSVLLNRELTKFAHQDSLRAMELYLVTKSKFDENTVLKTDLNNAAINLRNTAASTSESDDAYNNAIISLKSTIGSLDLLNDQLSFSDDLEKIFHEYNKLDTNQNSLKRPDILLGSEQISRLGKQIEMEGREFLPVISLDAFWGQNNYSNGTQPIRSSAWFGNSYVSVTLDVPITSNLGGIKRIESLKVQKMQKNLQLREQIFEADKESAIARSQIRISAGKLEASKYELKLRMENFQIYEDRYKQAQSSFTDLLNAENELKLSEKNYVQQLYNLLSAYLNFENATGIFLDK